MNSFLFWKSWRKPDQIIFYLFVSLATIALVYFWVSWWTTPAPTINYDSYQQLEKVETAAHSFQVGTMKFSVPANSYVILESVLGSPIKPNIIAYFFLIVALLVAFTGYMTVISSLSRFYFLGGMTLAILFIRGLGIHNLLVFGFSNQTVTVVVALLFGGVGFYFNSFYQMASLGLRLLFFSATTVLVAGVIHFFSQTADPFLHLSANGLLIGIVISIVFLVIVSHEIVAAAVAISNNAKSNKSIRHFLLLTVFYLINVGLLYASKTGLISWGFFSVNSFFLLTLSAALGYWGFLKITREGILSDQPTASVLYSCLLAVCLATLGYLAATANTMMLDAFEVFILATHVACGLIFLLYIIANFGPMLAANLPVYKVLYKPETMPLFTFRIMSLIAVFATISLTASWNRYVAQASATYFNAIGDIHLSQGDDTQAETNYKQSIRIRNQNLHAHYALAGIYSSRFELFNEKKEYLKITEFTPDPKAFINLSELFYQERNSLKGNLTLSEGLTHFPKSGELKNALGLSFLKFKAVDSALFYFQAASTTKSMAQVAETNTWATKVLFRLADTDSAKPWARSVNGISVNRLAMANEKNQHIKLESDPNADTLLSVFRAAFYSNELINQKNRADTSLISRVLNLAKKPCNDDFSKMLLPSAAQAQYARGEVKKAIKLMREVAYQTQDANYFNLIGLWLLEQNNPVAASGYFEKATEKKFPQALFYQAFTQTEAGKLRNGYVLWDSVSHAKNTSTSAFANLLKHVLSTDSKQIASLTDEGKYYFCRYKIPLEDSIQFNEAVKQIQNPALSAQAYYDRAVKWFAWDEPARAVSFLSKISVGNDHNLSANARSLRIMIAAHQRDVVFLKKNSAWINELSPYEKAYIEAVLAQASGDQAATTSKFEYLAQANEQFEEGLVAASQYFAKDTTNRLQRFSFLVDGLLAKPNSVKILKQYVLQAIALGLEPEAQEALQKLQALLPEALFKKFAGAHPDLFQAQ
ncbi:MAG: hypothetical protein OJF59_000493 [Cytophagales bacterium]|jgi:Tfp pilus assembly protein PilF|nr:hypothetical protein [Bacteroidota bacterium]MBS1981444.1 hypothetical protein [Bacteroidota bacterium]WHZ06740.1 MAG: hypothetical protein OJF59_000493 [Cytophagales bacterium]